MQGCTLALARDCVLCLSTELAPLSQLSLAQVSDSLWSWSCLLPLAICEFQPGRGGRKESLSPDSCPGPGVHYSSASGDAGEGTQVLSLCSIPGPAACHCLAWETAEEVFQDRSSISHCWQWLRLWGDSRDTAHYNNLLGGMWEACWEVWGSTPSGQCGQAVSHSTKEWMSVWFALTLTYSALNKVW